MTRLFGPAPAGVRIGMNIVPTKRALSDAEARRRARSAEGNSATCEFCRRVYTLRRGGGSFSASHFCSTTCGENAKRRRA